MNKSFLHTLKPPVFLGKKSESEINLKTLVRLKKLISDENYSSDYDFNNDGVLDVQDVIICRKILLGLLNAEDYI